jgi:signal transduction histidine kinase
VPLLDKLRINQIVFNLLSNAVKYTPEGGHIRCTVRAQPLPDGRPPLPADPVADNGIGMSGNSRRCCSLPFTQENRDDNSELRGSGLGLAITKRLVELMGGTISVESKSGSGLGIYRGPDGRTARRRRRSPRPRRRRDGRAEPAFWRGGMCCCARTIP